MALYGDLTFDSRVRREARTLVASGYEVTIVCLADRSDRGDLPYVNVIVEALPNTSVSPGALNPFRVPGASRLASVRGGMAWLWRYVASLRAWGRAAVARAGAVDAWHVHDFTGLAAISPAIGSRTLVYDVHDLMLETGTAVRIPRPLRAVLRWYEGRVARRARAILTVNAGLARVLQRQYPDHAVVVVHNCPERPGPAQPGPGRLRRRLGLGDEDPLVGYHGSLTSGRGIEIVLEALLAPGLEQVHFALLGFGPDRASLQAAASDARWSGRVHVVDAVPPSELLPWIAGCDLGVVLHPGILLNDELKTPNKLFELLAAGVPILGSDLSAMQEIVLADPGAPLGVLCDPKSVDAVAEAMRAFFRIPAADRHAIRARCVAVARDRWNWETESLALSGLYRRILTG